MNARTRNHSVVAEQWCAPGPGRTRSAFRRVSLGKSSKRLHTWQGPSVADRSLKERGGEHLSMRRLVAEKGEPGEDHSECTSDQQTAARSCRGRSTPVTAPPDAVSKPANSMESAAQGERSWTVRVEDPGDINRSGRGYAGSSIAVMPKASRTLWTYGRSAGAIQIWDGSRSRASTSSATPPHTESKDSDGG